MRIARSAALLLCLGVAKAGAQADPAVVGEWASAAPLPFYTTALHLLPTGKVLFYGGDTAANPGTDTRIWDPATATTINSPAKPGYDVFCSGHAYLGDGRLLIAGGHISNTVGLAYASLYDALNDVWVRAPNMNAGRWYPTATTLANGDVLVLSGSIDSTLGTNNLPQVFQLASGTWRDLTSAQLGADWYARMHLAPNGRLFNSSPSETTRYLDPSGTGAWSVVGNRVYGYRDYGTSVMYEPGKVLVMGGGDPPTNTSEVIDLNAPSPLWRAVGQMAIQRRQLNATLLPDGKVLATGGTSGPGFNNPNTPVFAAEMWDPATESWTTMASAQTPRLYHSAAVLLPDGRVFTSGGNNYPQVELYSPPYLFKGQRPSITSAPSAVGYAQSFFVATPDAAAIARVTWIRLGSATHAFDMNQRFNALTFSQAPGGLTVMPPSNPNFAPPGHYMLFLLNASGVPSVAAIVRLDGGGNTAPTVSAGADQTITLPASANLAGSASDDGPITTTWSKLSGPGTVTFANPNALSTTASFAAAGTYVLRLTASDGALSSADDVIVTVNAASGEAGGGLTGQYYNDRGNGVYFTALALTRIDPTVNFDWGESSPGAGVTVNLFSVRWTGQVLAPVSGNYTFSTVSDDGVRLWVNNQLVINNWTNHGPTTNNSAPITLVGGTKYAITMEYYDDWSGAVARLLWTYPGQAQTAIPSSNLFPASGTPSPNQAPSVNAGADQTVTLPASASLAGGASDDGLPNPPGTLATAWSKLSGPGTVTFANASALSTTASFSTSGSYTLRLTANDGALASTDDVIVTVNPGGPANQAPLVNAGADQAITLPASANLAGTASDDGPITTTWSKLSGPGTVTFANPNSLSTTASFSTSGTYALRLTASDGALTASDDVIVTVNAAPGGTGTGLRGQYYNDLGNGVFFRTLVLTRTDPTVNFNWAASPAAGVAANNFSVRWTGQVLAPVSGNYTFSTVSDDGVRLWVNGQLVINNWTNHAPTTNNSAPVALVGGTKYAITMEFYDDWAGAVARLLWAYPGQAQAVIPQANLFP